MTRQLHDQFAKEYLEELLTPLGVIKKSEKVSSEVQEIDVWFEPSNSAPTGLPLGLLGKMATTSCLFEPFRNPPSETEICSCLLKLYAVHGNVLRKAKREKQTIPFSELAFLWILTPTFSTRMIEGLGGKSSDNSSWGKGVYIVPYIYKMGIVAIHQLPVNEDTLWLRILGKGTTQKRAVEELVSLPNGNPFRENLLEILANWRINLELRDNLTNEQQEDIMNLSPAYLKQREEWKLEGKEEGRLSEINLISYLLNRHLGSFNPKLLEKIQNLSIEQLENLGKAFLDFNSESDLADWLDNN